MEKAKPSNQAIISTLVEVSPAMLREIANLLELSSQRATPTETILVSFTDRITFAYRPAAKVADQVKEKIKGAVRGEDLLPLEIPLRGGPNGVLPSNLS